MYWRLVMSETKEMQPLKYMSASDRAMIRRHYINIFGDVPGVELFGPCPRCKDDFSAAIPVSHPMLEIEDGGLVSPKRLPCAVCGLKVHLTMAPLPWNQN